MSLRHTLLGILDWIPLHGYALRETARGYAWIYPMSNANIYPTLRELENEGFVLHRDEVHEGRLRKIYTVTDSGKAELRRWLADPTGQRGTYRDPTLLKICLLRGQSIADARGWIENELRECGRVVDEAERFLKDHGPTLPKYTRLVAEHGHSLARLRTQWLGEVLHEIEHEVESQKIGV